MAEGVDGRQHIPFAGQQGKEAGMRMNLFDHRDGLAVIRSLVAMELAEGGVLQAAQADAAARCVLAHAPQGRLMELQFYADGDLADEWAAVLPQTLPADTAQPRLADILSRFGAEIGTALEGLGLPATASYGAPMVSFFHAVDRQGVPALHAHVHVHVIMPWDGKVVGRIRRDVKRAEQRKWDAVFAPPMSISAAWASGDGEPTHISARQTTEARHGAA
jgi:hypothetical protein